MDLDALTWSLLDDGLTAIVVPGNGVDEPDRVEVMLQVEFFDEPVTLQILPIANEPDELGGLRLVQLYAPLLIELTDEGLALLLQLIPMVNESLPLVGFGAHLADDDPFVYYRHVALVPPDDTARRLVTEAAWLTLFAIDMNVEELAEAARTGN